MALTKEHIAKAIRQINGFKRNQAAEIVETIFETIKATLANGEDVKIKKFGQFRLYKIKARQGRNPYTGGELSLLPKTIVKYKCSPALVEKVNNQAQ
jgi:integration host factor subunit alpha